MNKLSVFIILLLIYGCGLKVNYVFKNYTSPPVIRKIKTVKFGVIINGDAISGLYDVIKTDLSYYQGKEAGIKQIKISANQVAKIEVEDFYGLNFKNCEHCFIFIIKQDKPEIKRNHYEELEGKEFWGEPDRDCDVYTTTISINCTIFLYNPENGSLLAKSAETFSQTEKNKVYDLFPDYTLFGIVEDILKKGRTDKDEYPILDHLDAQTISGYFLKFLKGIEN